MTFQSEPSGTDLKLYYSFFTNEYVLSKEMCAEMETARLDVGIAFELTVAAAMMIAFFRPLLEIIPEIPALLYDYFSSPSPGTVLELSGFNLALPGVSVSLIGAVILLIRSFPALVGDKRFNEQLHFVPSVNRSVNFYDKYVEVKGKFSKKLPYKELKRTGETRSLYLLFFTERRIVLVPKSGFRKGSLAELKPFIRKRRTLKSKIYGKIRYLPVLLTLLLFTSIFWWEF